MSELFKLRVRRDLSRWSRKLLLCIGLENVGRNLVGDGKWEVLYPHDWREEAGDQRTPDFDPAQVGHEPADTPQELNNSELPHIDPSETPEEEVQEEKNELLENFFHLLPYWYFINRAFGSSSTKDLDLSSLNPAQLLAAHTAALNSNPDNTDHLNLNQQQNQNNGSENNPLLEALDAQRLNSLLFFESLKQLQLQQQHGGGGGSVSEGSFGAQSGLPFFSGEMLEELSKRSRKGFNDPIPQTLPGLSILNNNLDDHTDDQPLDLTQKNKKSGGNSGDDRPPPMLWGGQLDGTLGGENSVTSSCMTRKRPPGLTPDQVGRIAKASPRPASQRAGKGYTTQELEAALRDIQSGKLGTRRAAVIYGIPRSTLRNKVYKMGKDRSRPYFRQNNPPLLTQEGLEDPVGHQVMPAINAHLPKDHLEKNNMSNYTTILGSTLIKRNSNSNGIKNNNNNFSDEEPDDEYEDDEVDQKQHLSSLLSSHLNNNNSIKLDHRSVKQEYGGEKDDDRDKGMSTNGFKKSSSGGENDGRGGDEISHEKKVLKEWLQSKLQSKQSMILRGMGEGEVFGGVGDQSDNSSENSDLSSRGKESGRRDVILKIPSLINNKSSLSNSNSNSGGATSRYNSMISQGSGRRKLGRINRNVVDNLGEDSDLPLVINKRNDEDLPMSLRGRVGHSDMEEDMIDRDQDFEGSDDLTGIKRIKLDPNIFERDEDEDGDGDGDEDVDVDCRLSGVGGLEYDTAKLLYHRKKSLLKQMMSSAELSPQSSSSFLNQQFTSSLSSNNNNNSNDANGKKSRPKRGKYRNYDRDALLKAVRAVQAGEMSVHRAGSFFGVPHSTLEYKVKERHLLRRPKRKGLIAQVPSSPKSLHCKSSPDSSDGSDAQSSLNFQQNPHQLGSPDLRESLSRYLIMGGQIPPSSQSQSHYPSNASSPDPTNNNSTPKGKKSNENSGDLVIRPSSRSPSGVGTPPSSGSGGGKNLRTIESLKNLGRGGGAGFASSPFLNIFQLDDLFRQNLENNSSHLNNSTSTNSSLLDLSKKS